MPKLTWDIERPQYGHQFNVVASTRTGALAAAEARFLKDTDWELELVGKKLDDGTVFKRSAIPDFIATKVGRARTVGSPSV